MQNVHTCDRIYIYIYEYTYINMYVCMYVGMYVYDWFPFAKKTESRLELHELL